MKKIYLILFTLLFVYSHSQKNIKLNSTLKKLDIKDWILNRIESREFENKFVVINIINSLPNNAEFNFIDHFNTHFENFRNKNLIILTIVINDNIKSTQNIFKNKDVKFPVCFDKNSTLTESLLRSKDFNLPLTLLLDDKSQIKWVGLPYFVDTKTLDDLISGKLTIYNMFAKEK